MSYKSFIDFRWEISFGPSSSKRSMLKNNLPLNWYRPLLISVSERHLSFCVSFFLACTFHIFLLYLLKYALWKRNFFLLLWISPMAHTSALLIFWRLIFQILWFMLYRFWALSLRVFLLNLLFIFWLNLLFHFFFILLFHFFFFILLLLFVI